MCHKIGRKTRRNRVTFREEKPGRTKLFVPWGKHLKKQKNRGKKERSNHEPQGEKTAQLSKRTSESTQKKTRLKRCIISSMNMG